jgi:Fe-S oxidoreductase
MRLLGGLFNNKTLYFPGCTTRTILKEIKENYEAILKELEIEYIELEQDEFCCGQPIKQLGYDDEFDELKKKNKKTLSHKKIATIITNDPHCYDTLKKSYNLDVEHILSTIMKNKHTIEKQDRGKIMYHDPCFLSRHNDLINAPREILKEIGYEVVEMKSNKRNTKCCGGTVKLTNPELARKMAEDRLNEATVKRIVTACPLCYKHLKDNAKDVQVYELSQLLKGVVKKA